MAIQLSEYFLVLPLFFYWKIKIGNKNLPRAALVLPIMTILLTVECTVACTCTFNVHGLGYLLHLSLPGKIFHMFNFKGKAL